jgi:hypothetical protein
LETVGLRFPVRQIRDFAFFNVCSSNKNCPSAGYASAADDVCRDVDVFRAKIVFRNDILQLFFLRIKILIFSPQAGRPPLIGCS